jgi:two-component system, OmpR family, KDP operon response regulator KdpE
MSKLGRERLGKALGPGAPRPAILVIEDETPLRRVLRACLRSQDYSVLEATTGKDGLAQAAAKSPDLILLDLGLPDLDGLVVLERLRARSSAPLIVVSGRSAEADQVKALDAGANDYVTKPFRVGELLARVRGALRRSAGADLPRGRLSSSQP